GGRGPCRTGAFSRESCTSLARKGARANMSANQPEAVAPPFAVAGVRLGVRVERGRGHAAFAVVGIVIGSVGSIHAADPRLVAGVVGRPASLAPITSR